MHICFKLKPLPKKKPPPPPTQILTKFTLVYDEVHEIAKKGHDDAEYGQEYPVFSHLGYNDVMKRPKAFWKNKMDKKTFKITIRNKNNWCTRQRCKYFVCIRLSTNL